MKTPIPVMTFDNAWALVILRAIDILWASIIWREYDITISSLTGLELRKTSPRRWARVLGWVLNHIQPNHCELAIAADIMRAHATLTLLGE